MLSLPAFYTEADCARIVGKIQAWTDLFSRHTLGAHSSRHRAQEEKTLNRQKQLDDVQARYEATDPRTFQVAFTLEAQNVKQKQDDKGRNTKPGPKLTVHQQSALGSVLSQNPALADEYNLQVKKTVEHREVWVNQSDAVLLGGACLAGAEELDSCQLALLHHGSLHASHLEASAFQEHLVVFQEIAW